MNAKYDSVIFDLDGTLWDSTGTVARAWQAAAEKTDYVQDPITQEVVRSITGMMYDAIYDKLFPYLTPVQRQELKEQCAAEEIAYLKQYGGNLYPELKETLRYLQSKYRLFIVSNCQSGYIETFLEFSGLHSYFEDHQCYGTKGKPKSENIKDVIERNNLKAPVYVGDTTGDQKASREAQVPFIFASYGFHPSVLAEETTILKFADLQELL